MINLALGVTNIKTRILPIKFIGVYLSIRG